jgi:hypothetical protein
MAIAVCGAWRGPWVRFAWRPVSRNSRDRLRDPAIALAQAIAAAARVSGGPDRHKSGVDAVFAAFGSPRQIYFAGCLILDSTTGLTRITLRRSISLIDRGRRPASSDPHPVSSVPWTRDPRSASRDQRPAPFHGKASHPSYRVAPGDSLLLPGCI